MQEEVSGMDGESDHGEYGKYSCIYSHDFVNFAELIRSKKDHLNQ